MKNHALFSILLLTFLNYAHSKVEVVETFKHIPTTHPAIEDLNTYLKNNIDKHTLHMKRLVNNQKEISNTIAHGIQSLMNAHPDLSLAEKSLLTSLRDFILQFDDHMQDASNDGLNAIKTAQHQLDNLMLHSHKVVHDALKSQESMYNAAQKVSNQNVGRSYKR